MGRRRFPAVALIGLLSAPGALQAADSYSPYAGQKYPTTVYWGDTHLHTSMSLDAYAFGTRLTPADAYRFARGETVVTDNGMRAQLRKPLDFLVVADHAEFAGGMQGLVAKNSDLLATDDGRR